MAVAIKQIRHLLKHSGVYAVGNIFAQAAGFLLLPFYTHYLTPSDYGIAALVETTIAIIGVTVSMGIGYSLARFHSREAGDAGKNLVISTAYGLVFIICILAIPLLYAISPPLSQLIFGQVDYGTFFFLSGTALFIGLNLEVGLIYLNIRAKSIIYVVISLANTITLISLNIYFIAFQKTGLVGIFYSALIAKAIYASLLTLFILIQVKPRFSLRVGVEMVRFSLPLGLSTVFRIITQQSDKLFINYFFSPLETGIYAVAGKIANGVHILVTTTFLRSYQSIRFEINKEPDGPRIYGAILEQYLLVLGSFALFISVYSGEIIKLMTTKDFYASAYYIPPIILAWIFFGMKYHLENGILISMKTRYVSYVAALASVVNIVLNLVLIPAFGIWGAVLAINLSNIVLAGASFVISQDHYPISVHWGKLARLAGSLALFFSLAQLVPTEELGVAIGIKAILLLAYACTVYLFGLIEPGVYIRRRTTSYAE